MWKRKRHRKNRYKRRSNGRRGPMAPMLINAVSLLAVLGVLAAVSLGFIYVHDMLIQSDVFAARQIAVSGNRQLSTPEIQHLAGIKPGVNIFVPNLSRVRQRLLSHPWIAEASVQRNIPDGIRIQIKEHQPRAIVVIGRSYLLSDQGIIFKEKMRGDPDRLPMVKGLRYADLNLTAASERPALKAKQRRHVNLSRQTPEPWRAMLEILRLSRKPNAVIPFGSIREIRVDRQIGVTLVAFEDDKEIRIGFHDYNAKLDALQSILKRFEQSYNGRFTAFRAIDLRNPDRIVMNPGRHFLPKEGQKEV